MPILINLLITIAVKVLEKVIPDLLAGKFPTFHRTRCRAVEKLNKKRRPKNETNDA